MRRRTNVVVIIAEQERGRGIGVKFGHEILGCILLAAGAGEHVCMPKVEGRRDALWEACQGAVHIINGLLAVHLQPARRNPSQACYRQW